MPKDDRRSARPRTDGRPAFSRPPGALPPDDDDDYDTPRNTPRRTKDRERRKAKESPAASPADRDRRRRHHSRQHSSPTKDRAKYTSGSSADSGSHLLSADALSKLNAYNQGEQYDEKRERSKQKRKEYKNINTAPEPAQRKRKRKNRDVSGAILEEGRGKRHSRRRESEYYEKNVVHKRDDPDSRKRRKKWFWIIGGLLVLLAIFIPVGVVVSNNNRGDGSGSGSTSNLSGDSGNTAPTNDCKDTDVPENAKGTYTDITTWMDTQDFNCTYTAEMVGGLSVMGLNSKWDDSVKANDNVPALNDDWEYGKKPIRGVNVGGWLVIEPFITPSLFRYPASDRVVDEYTLTTKLGSSATRTLEQHYATFISKKDFANIRAAGFDHVRIPYPYWAVETYDGDPYVAKIAWRYLLRAIEWCRENGLRVNLDLHSVPGSQNGWTHSGRLGAINWISGPDGATNAQRSLDIHKKLSTFFAQPRYANIITIYGLVNEPKMIDLDVDEVISWNEQAVKTIRGAGLSKPYLNFGDGFLKLSDWQGEFQGADDKLILDTHQYQIFNTGQLPLNHSARIALSCSGYTGLLVASNNPQTGWGPTLDGEWSQADTDCAPFLNNVGVGSRWTGTLNLNDPKMNVLEPLCPTAPDCSCDMPNADPATYSAEYKQFLQMYAEAQMDSFEKVWGWFYWTWKTEDAVQWSWMLGLEAGILPEKAYAPKFRCGDDVPAFATLSGSA